MRNKSIYILNLSGVTYLLDGFISTEVKILVGIYKIYYAKEAAKAARW